MNDDPYEIHARPDNHGNVDLTCTLPGGMPLHLALSPKHAKRLANELITSAISAEGHAAIIRDKG